MGQVNVLDTKLADVKIVTPKVFGDQRGFFTESWSDQDLKAAGILIDFVQDNHSHSGVNVLRGMHYQKGNASQTKLVRVTRGAVYDVILDMRKGSPSFGQWQGFILSESNHRQLLVPKGFAHGFVTLTDDVDFLYKVDTYYTPGADAGIAYDDPDLGIDWPIDIEHAVLSEKDTQHPQFKDAYNDFVYGEI